MEGKKKRKAGPHDLEVSTVAHFSRATSAGEMSLEREELETYCRRWHLRVAVEPLLAAEERGC